MNMRSKRRQTIRRMAQTFLALADPVRLRMLNLMLNDEVSVHYFTIILKLSGHTISQHLVYLRNGGFVAGRRIGRTYHYFVPYASDSIERQLLQLALQSLTHAPEMQEDLAVLRAMESGDHNVRASRPTELPAWASIAASSPGGASQRNAGIR